MSPIKDKGIKKLAEYPNPGGGGEGGEASSLQSIIQEGTAPIYNTLLFCIPFNLTMGDKPGGWKQ